MSSTKLIVIEIMFLLCVIVFSRLGAHTAPLLTIKILCAWLIIHHAVTIIAFAIRKKEGE